MRRGSLPAPAGAGGEAGSAGGGPGTSPVGGGGHGGGASAAQAGQASPSGGVKPIRRRMRMITSCLECRRRKLKCNKSHPCTNCFKFSRDCLYLGSKLDEVSQMRLTEIKERVGSLERQLERDVAKSTARGMYQQRIVADDIEDEFDGERDLEITPMVGLDLTYEDDADATGTDDLIDLGVKVGRMRITERIGGLNRPRIAEELQAGLSSTHPALSYEFPGYDGPPGSDFAVSGDAIPDFLRPSSSFILPTSGFFFGQVMNTPEIIQLLPGGRETADRLMRRYFDAVHPIARCVHRPSFEVMYESFWEDTLNYYEPRASIQAMVFAAWFSAAVSLDEDRVLREYNQTKSSLVQWMKIGTEVALSKANFLRTTKVETLQAFVMYMLPLCREEVSRAHSVLVGAAVRMAECMGLHRDGENYGFNPLETHVRRLIWHQLCFLDIRTCEAQGPKPGIRREDYDTNLPLNCEEDELSAHSTVPPQPAEHWTSALLSIMRFEINEMMRIIWSDRRKLETRKSTLTAVLTKIENFRKRLYDKYNHFLDDRVPVQRYAKLVMHLLVHRLHAMVLHPYHTNATSAMPDRLKSVLIMSGIMIIETSIQLETNPFFRDWAWYLGAYQQYQIALLLATDVHYNGDQKDADRIWACLDYVFDLEPNMPRDRKSRCVLNEILGKTSVYRSMRKMRAPTAIATAVVSKQPVKDSPPAQSLSPYHQQQQQPQQQHQQQQQYPQHHQIQQHHHPHQQVPFHGAKTEPGMPPVAVPMEAQNPQGCMPPNGYGMQPTPALAPAPVSAPATSMAHQMVSNMVYAGVSNGEVLWGLPQGNPGSPENSSDGGSVVGHPQRHGSLAGQSSHEHVMDNLDWDAINTLFPADPNTGEFNFNSFMDPSIGMMGGNWPPDEQ
ncbi:fungal-specific transcription factor domain-containing protein [Podospora appendiculata]|uniref:Fungal-specific transcription factor domain-containing protein n=1 Tax=Podospora appendiculata TaxID=314037 RepID=A0AAE1CHX5_9PEZI|nr:fungal-specific transcription factor domain-containing protein [Podospora appendiculata]